MKPPRSILSSLTGVVVVSAVVVTIAIWRSDDAVTVDAIGRPASIPAGSPADEACEAPTEVVRIAGRSEELLAGWLPAGFTRTKGVEGVAFPRLGVSYSVPGGRSYLELTRVISAQPPGDHIAAGPEGIESTTTVRGHEAVIVQGREPGAGRGSRVLLAWKELPDVTVIITGYNSSLKEVQRFAELASYRRGELPTGTGTSSCRRVLPEGALARQDALAVSAGPDPEAKLVRLSDLEAVSPGLLQCQDLGCDPGVVAWAVLTHAFAPRYGSPATLTPTGAGWTLVVVDAATGRARGGSASGPGDHPPFWSQLEDLAPYRSPRPPSRVAPVTAGTASANG